MSGKANEFDYTMMSTYLTCQRKYYYRHTQGLTGKHRSYPLEFGHAIHEALDSWWTDKDVDKAVTVFKADYEENVEEEPKRTHQMGEWMLRNYASHYQDQPMTLIESEQSFRLPLPNGNWLVGRIDKIVSWAGYTWIVDHKTTSQLGAQYFKMTKPNLQFAGYVWAAKQLGHNVVGVLVDVLLVAKGLLSSSSRGRLTPLIRFDSYVDEGELDEWLATVVNVQESIMRSIATSTWIPNFDACTYYGECPYRRVCKEPPQMRDRVIDLDYEVNFWSPLDRPTKKGEDDGTNGPNRV